MFVSNPIYQVERRSKDTNRYHLTGDEKILKKGFLKFQLAVFALVSASFLIVITTILALIALPPISLEKPNREDEQDAFSSLFMRKDLILIYACGGGGFLPNLRIKL